MPNARLALLIALVASTMVGCTTAPQPVERYGMVIRLKKEKLERYKQLHADPWQGVLEQCDRSHLRNFSIWLGELRPDVFYLFGYFEYDGDELVADMATLIHQSFLQENIIDVKYVEDLEVIYENLKCVEFVLGN